MKYLSKSETETQNIARDFLGAIKPMPGQALVVQLHGDLGSGKTTFVRFVGSILGVTDRMTSPTFTLMKIYPLPSGKLFTKLYHIDAYRLKNVYELKYLGWENVIKNPFHLVFIEWPEHVADVIPAGARCIDFQFIDEHSREILIWE